MRTQFDSVVSLSSLAYRLIDTEPIHTGEWQAMQTTDSPAHATHELEDVKFVLNVPRTKQSLVGLIQPDLPWADDHFAERVSGIPHNPPPSAASWPHAVRGNADHIDTSGRFDHTYPERFWPKYAGAPDGRGGDLRSNPNRGIRFEYGDLSDVVSLLMRNPLTRQAYLPVWFPEDTGASAHKGPADDDPSPIRVPCTLGYHFMIRDGHLSCRYFIRSCDMRRHFINDVYFAARLTQWMCDQVSTIRDEYEIMPGRLVMYISSLHCFVGDVDAIRQRFIDTFPS